MKCDSGVMSSPLKGFLCRTVLLLVYWSYSFLFFVCYSFSQPFIGDDGCRQTNCVADNSINYTDAAANLLINTAGQ